MRLVYNLGIRIFYLIILLASLFNPKAKQWIAGRRGLLRRIANEVDPEESLIWFHCSSLGEFEQGRPVMEMVREKLPGKKILLTFYSPSGYEVRKNYPGADHIFYLPLDTKKNASRFMNLMKIEQAFFIKYEYWYHFLSHLHSKTIPVYLISGIFRQDQAFFKWYGKWYRKILHLFDHLFVQQESSVELLASIGIRHASVNGDTRFDRVFDIARKITPDEQFQSFCGDSKIIVAGSTWPADQDLLSKYINETDHSCKWIIAPHEIHNSEIEKLEGLIRKKTQRYSKLIPEELPDCQVLIIDTIGLLSSLYQYADISYIGGGFGKGIHNTLEAATFGNPVIFGPKYQKFQEARDLVSLHAAFPVEGYEDLIAIIDRFLEKPDLLKTSGDSAEEYVKSKLGGSSRIVDFAFNYNLDIDR